jgi:hypothetical protein
VTPPHYSLGTMGFCVDVTGCSPATVEIVGHSGRSADSRALVTHHRDRARTIVVPANIDDIELPELATLLPVD